MVVGDEVVGREIKRWAEIVEDGLEKKRPRDRGRGAQRGRKN